MSIFHSALSASPRLCVRFPLRRPSPLPLPPATATTALQWFPLAVRRLARRRFVSRRGAERQRAQRLIGLRGGVRLRGNPSGRSMATRYVLKCRRLSRVNLPLCALCLSAPLREVPLLRCPSPLPLPLTTALQRFPLAVRRLARRLFASRRGAERQRAQRLIGLRGGREVERGHEVEWEEDSSNPLTTRT